MKYKDLSIINAIKKGGREEQLAASTFFDAHKDFVHVVASRYKLTIEERQSAYADSVMAVMATIKNGRYRGKAKLKTYLFRIFNNNCVNFLQKKRSVKMSPQRAEWIDDHQYLSDDAISVVHHMMAGELLDDLMADLQKTGEKCKRLLFAFGRGLSISEVMKLFNYSSKGSVKTMKYKCMQRLLKHRDH